MERAERETGKWFEAVWEHAADAMALSDADGIVVAANPAYFALYGYGPDEVIGHSFAIIFPEADRAAAREGYRSIFMGTEEAVVMESVVRRADGEDRVVESRYAFLVEDGRRTTMLSIIRDITERKQLERKQREFEEQRKSFLAAAAHDLKNPLTTIKGFAQLLERRLHSALPPDPTYLMSGLQQIEKTVKRLQNLIDEMVDVSSMQIGQPIAVTRSRTDLLTVVCDVVTEQQLTTSHNISVESDLREVIGVWDSDRLRRAFANVLANAVKYSPGGDPITVRVQTTRNGSSWAVVSVQDRGMGIPLEDMPHVFDRFYRGSNVGEKIAGTGLGLSGVKHIVEQHGGTIRIESNPESGTTVVVRLPLSPLDGFEVVTE